MRLLRFFHYPYIFQKRPPARRCGKSIAAPFAAHKNRPPAPVNNQLTHNNGLRLVPPRVIPALDDGFRPAALANRVFRQAARQAPVPVNIALERGDGIISRFDTFVADASLAEAAANFVVIERLVKFLLWSRGA